MTRIFLQGTDFKAREWSAHIRQEVHSFTSLRDLAHMLLVSMRGDVIVYRYQNNDSRLAVAILEVMLLILTLIKSKLFGVAIVWICHNVDAETSPHFRLMARFRRFLLAYFSRLVLVLDPLFVQHAPGRKVRAISFGKKRAVHTPEDVCDQVKSFSEEHDLTILIASQDGLKYRSFSSIPEISSRLTPEFGRVGFVVAGMSADRKFSDELSKSILRISARQLDESLLSPYVDFVYRENHDISMPYTVYAAATARIPLLTRRTNILASVVEREGLGVSFEDLSKSTKRHRPCAFELFLSSHEWDSLAAVLIQERILT